MASDADLPSPGTDTQSRKRSLSGALQLGPRKKLCATDPLVHHGRHFGRTVHALCSIRTLLSNGKVRMGEFANVLEDFTHEERLEHQVLQELLRMVPDLEVRVLEGSEEDISHMAELLQRGSSMARSDDTKSLKGAILGWITPRGQPLNPPLARDIKTDRGFHHERTGALLCPAGLDWSNIEIKEKLRNAELTVAGDQWPIFLYQGCNYDPEDPWNGLFRSSLLISAFKHIFTSPSSVEKEPRATRSGNARIHGMTCVTPASIAYVATQVRFALSSSPVFFRSDLITGSERFYSTVIDLLNDTDEKDEVNDLMTWWNRQVFPAYSSARRPLCKNSALSRIKAKRLEAKNAGLTAHPIPAANSSITPTSVYQS